MGAGAGLGSVEKALAQSFVRLFIWRHEPKGVL